MKITDTLDMVGVKLCSNWTNTRSKNGMILREKVTNMCRSWKSGKFMPLMSRPHSINAYILSKVWFKCSTMNIRRGDRANINSSLKSWLYADCLLKPEEAVMFQRQSRRGLSLTSIKHKAQHFLSEHF